MRHIPDRRSHLCEVTSRAEACATASVLLQPSEPSKAPCSPLFLFPSSLHSHATLAIRPQRAHYHSGHTYDISCGAEACATTSDTSHPLWFIIMPCSCRYRLCLLLICMYMCDTLSSHMMSMQVLDMSTKMLCLFWGQGVFGDSEQTCCSMGPHSQ